MVLCVFLYLQKISNIGLTQFHKLLASGNHLLAGCT